MTEAIKSRRSGFALVGVALLLSFVALFAWLAVGFEEACREETAMAGLETIGGFGRDLYQDEYGVTVTGPPPGFLVFSALRDHGGAPMFTPWWTSRRWLFALTGQSRFLHLRDVRFGSQFGARLSLGETDWELIQSLTSARHVSFERCDFGEEQLGHLTRMRSLQGLSLSGVPVTGESFRYLKDLPELRHVSLRDTRLSKVGSQCLAQLSQLTELWLEGADDDILAHLPALVGLYSLDVRSAEITDAGVMHIGKMRSLEGLHLGSPRVSDRGLGHLRTLHTLKFLSLRCPRITGEGFRHLKDLPVLQCLEIRGVVRMSEVGKLQLGQLTRLRKLSLGAADDGILRQLTRMTSLTDLDLSNSPAVTDAGMVHVGKIQALKTLSLEGAHVSDSGMAEIAILPSLEELQIS